MLASLKRPPLAYQTVTAVAPAYISGLAVIDSLLQITRHYQFLHQPDCQLLFLGVGDVVEWFWVPVCFEIAVESDGFRGTLNEAIPAMEVPFFVGQVGPTVAGLAVVHAPAGDNLSAGEAAQHLQKILMIHPVHSDSYLLIINK